MQASIFMRSRSVIILLVILLLAAGSCKKYVENNDLIGNWKLAEKFDGYANGGNYQWNPIPSHYADTLSFHLGGRYQRSIPLVGICVGTYLVRTGNKLEVNSTCFMPPEKSFISELTATTLILDRQGREGVTRYKYSAIK